jgi:hypothetical protein
VLIYDRDLTRLKKKRATLQGTNGKTSDLRVFKLFLELDLAREKGYPVADLYVPFDSEVLPLREVVALALECDALIRRAQEASRVVKTFIANDNNAEILMNRAAIDGWLAWADRRDHLSRYHDGRIVWDDTCDRLARNLKKLTDTYENALEPLYQKLLDGDVCRKLSLCDYVLEGWDDPAGYHAVWSHDFFIEAFGLFAGTQRHKDVFENFVQPMFLGFAANFGAARAKCHCPTCREIPQENDPAAAFDRDEHFGKLHWKLKDAKIITGTGQRLIDLSTKFTSSWAFLVAMKEDFKFVPTEVAKLGLPSPNMLKRLGAVTQGLFKGLADRWWNKLCQFCQHATKFDASGAGKEAREIQDTLKLTRSVYPELFGNFLGILGGAISVVSFFTNKGRDPKAWLDLSKGITDIEKGAIALTQKTIAKQLAAKYGEENVKQFAKLLGKSVGLAGASAQLGSALLNLREAADEKMKQGDTRAFGPAMVQAVGADLYLLGSTLELAPIPVASQAAGVVVAVIGGAVYVIGQISGAIYRPGDEEALLLRLSYYDDDDHRTLNQRNADSSRSRRRPKEGLR